MNDWVLPASTVNVMLVTYRASSEARNSTALDWSTGSVISIGSRFIIIGPTRGWASSSGPYTDMASGSAIGVLTPVGLLVAFAVNLALWQWSFMVLPNRKLPWKAHLPGALLGALGMEVLKVLGAVWLPRTVANSSALYGSLGVVFAVLAWLLLFSRLVLYAATLNVVRWEKRAGTVITQVEVPAGRGIQPTDDVTRTGRVESDDAAA